MKQLLGWISPAGPNARLSVFIFHRVLSEPDPLFPDEMDLGRFDELCGWLAEWFNVLPLEQAVIQLKNATLPARAACITFDDGYADNHSVAVPVLQRHGLTATFFIATSFLDGGLMWNDFIIEAVRRCRSPVLDLSAIGMGRHTLSNTVERQQAIATLISQVKYKPPQERVDISQRVACFAKVDVPTNLMMTSNDVIAIQQAGMHIGAHTVTHPILANLTNEKAMDEIFASKRILEHLLGREISVFAYPNGKPGVDYSVQNVQLVRSLGFVAAVSTQSGASGFDDDPMQIKRFTPWDRTRLRFGLRVLKNLFGSRFFSKSD